MPNTRPQWPKDQPVDAMAVLAEFANRLARLNAYPPILPIAGGMLAEIIGDAHAHNRDVEATQLVGEPASDTPAASEAESAAEAAGNDAAKSAGGPPAGEQS